MLDLEFLARLHNAHQQFSQQKVNAFSIGGVHFDASQRRHLMGVVNLSSDSWYRESVCLNADAAIRRAKVLHAQGASIIDVGAESSLSHAARVNATEQQSILIPVVQALARENILVSIETYHGDVTAACLKAGAKVINLTGSTDTEAIFRSAAEYDAGVIVCFVKGNNVREVSDIELGSDPIPALYEYFARMTDQALRCGVSRLWIDPGLGFYYRNLQDSATRIRYQMNIFLNTFRLRALGFPVCHALPHAFECFEDEVRCAEPYFAVLALLGKTDLLRTHEISKVRAVLEAMSLF